MKEYVTSKFATLWEKRNGLTRRTLPMWLFGEKSEANNRIVSWISSERCTITPNGIDGDWKVVDWADICEQKITLTTFWRFRIFFSPTSHLDNKFRLDRRRSYVVWVGGETLHCGQNSRWSSWHVTPQTEGSLLVQCDPNNGERGEPGGGRPWCRQSLLLHCDIGTGETSCIESQHDFYLLQHISFHHFALLIYHWRLCY